MAFNILLVDDSRTIRAMIKKAIQLSELPVNEVLEAGDGEEALHILESSWVDLVFADLNMPKMTGLEMIQRMADNGLMKTIPVVLVSVEGSAKRIEELKGLGVRSFIRKPFTPERICSVVDELLRPHVLSNRDAVLDEVMETVLESFAFMFSELVPVEQIPTLDEDLVEAHISFDGEFRGTLVLAVPREMCPEIAANVLGIDLDEDLPAIDALDALKELLNIACGQVLTAIAGTGTVFSMSIPEASELDSRGWTNLRQDRETRAFLVDEHPVLLNLQVAESPP